MNEEKLDRSVSQPGKEEADFKNALLQLKGIKAIEHFESQPSQPGDGKWLVDEVFGKEPSELYEWVDAYVEPPTITGYQTVRYKDDSGKWISEHQGYFADRKQWFYDSVPNGIHHKPVHWLCSYKLKSKNKQL